MCVHVCVFGKENDLERKIGRKSEKSGGRIVESDGGKNFKISRKVV